MDGFIWSVGLVIDDVEARHLSENSIALYMLEATEGHLLRFSTPPLAEEEEVESLRLEVAASSAKIAEGRASNVVDKARRAAGLPDKVVPIAWVAPQGALEGDENYLDQAEELFEEERYGLAITAAEIHLESQAKVMIDMAVQRTAPHFEEALLQHRNNTKLRHSAGRRMIRRFLGLEVTGLPEWEEYRAHQARREQVVHAGKTFEEQEASDSIAVVRALWLRLARAARQAEDSNVRGLDLGDIAPLISASSS